MVANRRSQIRTFFQLPWIIALVLWAGAVPAARASDKNYCVNVDYSAVPTLCNYEKITLIVNVGTCASVAVTADGAAVSATYNASAGTAMFTTTGKSIVVTAQNWTTGGTGAATKATLYNNYHWAFSLTFDDGRLTQYEYGKPLLDALGWRAGSAVVGSWANTGGGPGSGNYYMNWATLQALRTAGWDIFNHSYDHPQPYLECSDIGTELSQNQTLLQQYFPGYNVTQIVFPYENDSADTCAGFPPSFLLSGECCGNSYNYVDVAVPFVAQRGGMYGTDDTAWKALAAQAAADSRPNWDIEFTHSVSEGSGAIADQYSTNQTTLTDLFNYLNTNFGASGNNSMWFAPAGEVRDYLFTRDNAVVTTCTAVTPTFTSTPASTATATRTNTPANTATSTATATSTYTRTCTPANTATLTTTSSYTPVNTSTKSFTPTATFTATSTSTGTPTSTSTASRTYTPTNTFTPTNTGTPTNTLQFSPTPTYSPTVTNTPTVSFTATSTSTGTPTFTSTASRTFTPTNTLTSTYTGTPSFTGTPTATLQFSPTITNTPTVTDTPTQTFTPTNTKTFTPTNSFTPTSTATNTYTFTSTHTGTPSFTGTPTATLQFSPTSTFTPTVTPTPTDTYTPTVTFTPTRTPTPTSTPTLTVTPTGTFTSTSTPSPTPTSAVVNLGTGATGTVYELPGAVSVTVDQVNMNNPSNGAVTLTSLTVTDSGSGNTNTIISVSVRIGGTTVGSPSVFTGNTATLNLNNYVLPASSGQNLQVVVSFSGSANGNYQVSVTGLTGTSANNGGQPAAFTGLPVSGYTVVVQPPTGTPSATPTITYTPTMTASPTSTLTPAPTPLPDHVGIYPNPAPGPTDNILPPYYTGVSNVRVEVFSLAFRKVIDLTFDSVPSGTAIKLELVGRSGTPLANGIYYVVVTTKVGRAIGKLLILR